MVISTGIDGLDEMLNGGIPRNEIVSVVGPPGSGKTIFSLQFLYNNLLQGQKCLYISSAHSPDELIENAAFFNWDFKPFIEKKQLIMKHFMSVKLEFRGGEARLVSDYLEMLPTTINQIKAEIIVIDSITEFMLLCNSDIEKRGRLLNLFQIIKDNGATSVITAESAVDRPGTSDHIKEYTADGVIMLHRVQSEDLSEIIHLIQILKMRWTKHSREIRQYDITDSGIQVYSKYNVVLGGKYGGLQTGF